MIIGISGKIGSGKDTVGSILQYLSCEEYKLVNKDLSHQYSILQYISCKEYKLHNEDYSYASFLVDKNSPYEIKKFAGKLKKIAALLIGCNVSDFENREFKNMEIGEEWDDLTPRKLLQLLGTEAGRQIIHPNIWVNALFADYKPGDTWIITDVRFPNEAQAIKDRGGVVIRVNRPQFMANGQVIVKDEHPSETALDDYEFDHVIDNNGNIEKLVEKVKQLNLV